MATAKPIMNTSVIWARSASPGDVTPPPQFKIDSGYFFAEKPLHDNFNSKLKQTDTMLVHIQENGITTWDAITEYQIGATTNEGGVLFEALVVNINKQPTLNLAGLTPIWNYAKGKTVGGSYIADQGWKNILINGEFRFAQRGLNFTNPTDYTADRWIINKTGAGDVDVTVAVTGGTGDLYSSIYMTGDATTSHTDISILQQRIERGKKYGGKKMALSLWRGGSYAEPIEVVMEYGEIANPANSEQLPMGQLVDGRLVFDLPNTTIVTADNTPEEIYLALQLHFPNPEAGENIRLTQIQLEVGDVVTRWEVRPYALELLACQRYYETGAGSGGNDLAPDDYTTSVAYFKAEKRVMPTITPTAGATSLIRAGMVRIVGVTPAAFSFEADAEL